MPHYPRTKTTRHAAPAATINNGPLQGRQILQTFEGPHGYMIKSALGSFEHPGDDETWWVSAYHGAELLGFFPQLLAWGTTPANAARATLGRIMELHPKHENGLATVVLEG